MYLWWFCNFSVSTIYGKLQAINTKKIKNIILGQMENYNSIRIYWIRNEVGARHPYPQTFFFCSDFCFYVFCPMLRVSNVFAGNVTEKRNYFVTQQKKTLKEKKFIQTKVSKTTCHPCPTPTRSSPIQGRCAFVANGHTKIILIVYKSVLEEL